MIRNFLPVFIVVMLVFGNVARPLVGFAERYHTAVIHRNRDYMLDRMEHLDDYMSFIDAELESIRREED